MILIIWWLLFISLKHQLIFGIDNIQTLELLFNKIIRNFTS